VSHFVRNPSSLVFALAPCALGEDQPNAYLPEGKSREAVADQIGPLLLVLHAVLEQLGADLDHNIEVAHIQRRLLSEPDLYVTGLHRPSRGFFRTFDRFANNIWQQLTQATQNLLAHLPVVVTSISGMPSVSPRSVLSAVRSSVGSRGVVVGTLFPMYWSRCWRHGACWRAGPALNSVEQVLTATPQSWETEGRSQDTTDTSSLLSRSASWAALVTA
jgi:hypothetical protein